jgi:hypothetical protein
MGDEGSVVGICSLGNAGAELEVPQQGFLLGDCMPYCWPVVGAKTCEIDYADPRYFCCCCDRGSCCNTGRRPVSLLARAARRHASALGCYFRGASRLEAASVEAFRLLGLELRAHDAPKNLRLRARRAARDELRHTRLTGALARRFGAEPERPRYGTTPRVRSLEAIALENAVEGCARETYGALVGLWQARHARDAEIARALRSIAVDEVRHAELSWDVAGWVEPQLSAKRRSSIAKARLAAFKQLEHEAASPIGAPLLSEAGLPPPPVAVDLVRALRNARL